MPDPNPSGGNAASAVARRRGLLLLAAGVAILAIGALVVWALVFRSDAPPAVGLATATPGASPSAATSPSTGSGSAPPSSSAGPASGASGIDGTWTVDAAVGSFSDFSGSFVGYRMDEQLAGVGAKTAVGRTPDVTGTMTIAGTTVTAVEMSADLSTLRSDDDRRDGQLRRQGLETGTYPTATFTLTKPIELGSVPAEGQVVDVTATGDLTLHGQTRSVDIPLQAKVQSGVITVTGSLPIVLADYGMTKPQSFIVLSIADHGTMELQLQLTKG